MIPYNCFASEWIYYILWITTFVELVLIGLPSKRCTHLAYCVITWGIYVIEHANHHQSITEGEVFLLIMHRFIRKPWGNSWYSTCSDSLCLCFTCFLDFCGVFCSVPPHLHYILQSFPSPLFLRFSSPASHHIREQATSQCQPNQWAYARFC